MCEPCKNDCHAKDMEHMNRLIDDVRKAGKNLLDVMARRGPLYPEYAEPIRTLRAAFQAGCAHVFINYQCEKCGKGQDMEKR